MHVCTIPSGMVNKSGGQSSNNTYSDASPFVRLLQTPSRVKIIDVFLGKHYEELKSHEIADLAGIDRSSVTRNISILEEAGIIEQCGKEGNAPQYRLNTDSEVSKSLGKTQDSLLRHSEEISQQAVPDEVPFDPEEVHLKEQDSDPRNLRRRVNPLPE